MSEEQAKEIEAIANEQVDFEQVATSAGEPVPEVATKDILEPVLNMAFGVLTPNWNVQNEEIQQLSEAYAGLVDKYFPDGVGDYGVEITAIMITGAVVIPRLKTPRKAEAVEAETEQDNGN